MGKAVKLDKAFIGRCKKLVENLDEVNYVISEKYQDKVYRIFDEAVEGLIFSVAPEFYHVVGNDKFSCGRGFVADEFYDALFVSFDLKKAKKCLKIYEKLRRSAYND